MRDDVNEIPLTWMDRLPEGHWLDDFALLCPPRSNCFHVEHDTTVATPCNPYEVSDNLGSN
jgi:hypothetical protein